MPNPAEEADPVKRSGMERALEYMGLEAGTPLNEIPVDIVFIGSCTNARLSDLQLAARFVEGKKIAPNLTAIVVPGSRPVKRAAEKLGLDKVFPRCWL